jgi:hypothetical protein
MSFVVTSNGDAVTFPTTFYDFEPFKYTFSNTNGSNIAVSGTYLSFCTGTGTSVITLDRLDGGFLTTGSTNGETIILTAGTSTITYKLLILNGRFQTTPQLSSVVLYRNEPLSITLSNLGYPGLTGISFTSATSLTSVPYTTPTLPSSLLTLGNPSADYKSFLLSGSCPLLSASSNYYFVGSNSSNGYVITTQFGIQVAGERIGLVPSTSSNVLTLSNAITPITFSCYAPISVTGGVKFTAVNLPPGLSLSSTLVYPVSNVATVTITGTPTYSASISSTYSSTLVASALGVTNLTSSSTISFSYTPSIIIASQTTNFYSNIAGSYQVVASLFPASSAAITFTSNAPVPGLSLSSNGLLTGTISSTSSVQVSANASSPVTVTVTAIPIPVTITSTTPSFNDYYIGQTVPDTTITFSSAAYPSLCNFIAPNGVSITGLPAGLSSLWVYPALTAVIYGTIVSNAIPVGSNTYSGAITITTNTVDGTTASNTIPYRFSNDSCLFTTISTSPFTFTQNQQIVPITFTGRPKSGLSLAYYYSDNTLPSGLYVSPGGIVQGAPNTVTSNTPFTGLYATTGNKLSIFSVLTGSSYSYSVLPDSALLTASPSAVALTVSSPVPTIVISNQTVSGLKLTNPYYSQGVAYPNNMVFTSYSYGLTATPALITGTLGSCTYPNDVVLPASVIVSGTLSPNAISTVFGLSNSNPQIINRYISATSIDGSNYAIFNDSGTSTFSQVYSRASTGVRSFQIISNATSTLSSWAGTLVITDGTSNTVVSSKVSPATFSLINASSRVVFKYSSYSTSIGAWVAYSSSTLLFSTSANVAVNGAWGTVSVITDGACSIPSATTPLGTATSGNIVRMFGTVLLLGGGGLTPLVYSLVPTIPSSTVTVTKTTITPSTAVYDIATSSALAVCAGTFTGSLAWSSDGINWTSGVGGFTTSAYSVIYSGLPAVGWLALGYNGTTPAVAWSLDGKTWTQIPFGFTNANAVGPAQFDGTYWCFFVTTSGVFTLYQHDALVSTIATVTTWTTRAVSLPNMSTITAFPAPIYTIIGVPRPTVFVGASPTGPVFTSPAVTNYPIYQYVPITSVVFSATPPAGSSVVYFLVSTLPPGMTWNSITSTISGLSVQLGTFPVSVYAQSTNGISFLTVTFIVSRVPIVPTLPTAAEYTSYIREKVAADAATSAVNNHATPFEVGPFALERPPVVTLAPELCCTKVKNIK